MEIKGTIASCYKNFFLSFESFNIEHKATDTVIESPVK